jgi:uncharacterized protein (TIGR03000 family)
MYRKATSFGGLLLLAGALVLVMPGPGQARGGFRGAGGSYGAAYVGGYGGYYGSPYAAYRDGSGYRSNYRYDPYASDGLGVTTETGYDGSYVSRAPSYSYGSSLAPSAAGYQSYYAPSEADNSARITVKVPAKAEVWFDGRPTTATGSVREFRSPPLSPGTPYGYTIRARWEENGHEVLQSEQVEVTAGARVSATFPLPKR